MEKRKIIIGAYDTALEGLWTLSAWNLGRAEAVEEYATIPGHGLLDLSTVLTEGEPYYRSREFEAVFESSEGDRIQREERINQMVNKLDGKRLTIVLPDDSLHYITGRVRVEKLYNDPAHASVRVSATCDPWRYNNTETVVGVTASSTAKTVSLINNGRLSLVPRTKVTGGTVTIKFTYDGSARTWTGGAGEYNFVDLYVRPGSLAVTYSGSGTITFTYREAVL